MIDSNINPHEQAVEELSKWEAKGIRHAFDPEIVVLADFNRKRNDNEEQKKCEK